MNAFGYSNPATVKDAVASLGSSWEDAAILAGGTDLLSLMKDNVMSPKKVVNIKSIKELGGIAKAGAGIRIGATVTLDELVTSALIRAELPAIFHAAKGVTSPQIRNMGTVGGDLCQRPRCWYFRQGHGVLAMHDGKSLVAEGENRYHAIFPSGPSHFVSASSFGPALVAYGAKIKVAGKSGNREIDAAQFFVAPKSAAEREIAIKPDEIVTEVVIPKLGMKSATYEVRERQAIDWPLMACSVALSMSGTKIGSAKVVLGHAGPTPVALSEVDQYLAGKTASMDTFMQAGTLAMKGARALSQNAYKIPLVRAAVARALATAAGLPAV
jgi:xanthine dehydrogenase YagS FAD-binding subunit